MRTAIFPGSFNPFTIGHQDIVQRALALFDEVVIAIGHNAQKAQSNDIQQRLDTIARLYQNEPRVRVIQYNTLTADLARSLGAQFIIRGVRNAIDFEYERSIAQANNDLAALETVLLYTKPEYQHISSSLVRELMSYGQDITHYLPH